MLVDETRCPVPEVLCRELLTQREDSRDPTTRIARLEREVATSQKRELNCQRFGTIPGVGRLTATVIVATITDVRPLRSGREFAAFLGLAPAHSSAGGRVRLLGIG